MGIFVRGSYRREGRGRVNAVVFSEMEYQERRFFRSGRRGGGGGATNQRGGRPKKEREDTSL